MKKLLTTACLAAGLLTFGSADQARAQSGDEWVGQMIFVGFPWCPRGWAATDGQLLAIGSNDAMFSLLGTMYGGDGRTTFGLPDFRGRTVLHNGSGPGLTPRQMGQMGGAETVTFTVPSMAGHNHNPSLKGTTSNAGTTSPSGTALANSGEVTLYAGRANLDASMQADTITVANTGGSQAVSIMQPSLTINTCIAEFGIYPSRN